MEGEISSADLVSHGIGFILRRDGEAIGRVEGEA